jgi:hypothetical protein
MTIEDRFLQYLKQCGSSYDDIQKTIEQVKNSNIRQEKYKQLQIKYNKRRYDKFNAVS